MNEFHNQLDRLVDGELTADERRDLLQQLDAQPARWRDCAVAFVEAQSLREALSSIANQDGASSPPGGAPAMSHRTASRLWPLGHWLAVAASVAVAFVAGRQFADTADPVSPGPTQVVENIEEQLDVEPVADADVLTLWTVNRDGQRQSLAVPLVEAEWIDQQLVPQLGPVVNDDVRKRFRQQGYGIESRRRYAPLVADNGQPYLLPVEDARIFPVAVPVH